MFKENFKYYKRKVPEPSLSEICDADTGNHQWLSKFELKCTTYNADEVTMLGLKHVTEWNVYQLNNHDGLIIIVNPFTNQGQRYWIARCVADFTALPSVTNLSSQSDSNIYLDGKLWWDLAKNELSNDERSTTRKLRWATMGYHHNWDTKVYTEKARGPFPSDLSRLSKLIVSIVMNIDFEPEASIVNFYLMDSFLSGHVDRSELNTTAPLVSFSFGQTAIFLIGGRTLEENADAIFLKSGDIVLMTGESRFHYHGVPKIIRTKYEFWNNFSSEELLTVRKSGTLYTIEEHENKSDYDAEDQITFERVNDKNFWQPFAQYIKNARINLNVRQVNLPGSLHLES